MPFRTASGTLMESSDWIKKQFVNDPPPVPNVIIPPLPVPSTTFSFVNGQAGTGKTVLARQWAEADESAQMVATTGIAAINLGGTTINAALRYFNTASMTEAYTAGWLGTRLRKLRDAGVSWIILDEVSMFSAHQLTMLVRTIQEVNQSRGGNAPVIKLTVVGDFAQLRPVNELFAFSSPEWRTVADHTITLTEIRRQSDRDFIEALQAVRVGNALKALQFFGDTLHQAPDINFRGTTLKGLNDHVNRFNQLQMDTLKSREVSFEATTWGTPRGEWKHIPRIAFFKLGALVMVLANKRHDLDLTFEYINGDMGVLEDVDSAGHAWVRLTRTQQLMCIEPVIRENLKPLEPNRRADLKTTGQTDKIKGKWEVVGQITYMPIRACWATTIHKVQGLSFDAVQIDIRNHFFREPGMLYTALSRARTAAGLRIVGSMGHFSRNCTVDPKVRKWL